jgi:uncharacterized protein (TIGR01777 family)
MQQLVQRSPMPVSAGELFDWHARPGAFERLVPPWQDVRVVERTGGLEEGSRLHMQLCLGPLRKSWVAVHERIIEGQEFTDWQARGPFAHWRHRHRCLPGEGPGGTASSILSDEIEYRLPLSAIAQPLAGRFARADLERMFRFRHERTRRDLLRHAQASDRSLHVAVTGSSGLLGTALCAFLTTGGHRVTRLVRRAPRERLDGTTELSWDPAGGTLDAAALGGVDAVVHLAGEPIAGRRWSARQKAAIRSSRIDSTRLLADTIAAMPHPPRTLVVASGAGFYGNRAAPADEQSSAGTGFLPETAVAWEQAAHRARRDDTRVVCLRIGVVLGAQGGMLRRLLLPFSLGLGGRVGSGAQPFSWISLDDAIGVIHRALTSADLEGPVNAVAPALNSQADFAAALGRTLRRPTVLPLPATVVRRLFGQMGQDLLLGGAPVVPAMLQRIEYPFLDRDLESALRFELGRLEARRSG